MVDVFEPIIDTVIVLEPTALLEMVVDAVTVGVVFTMLPDISGDVVTDTLVVEVLDWDDDLDNVGDADCVFDTMGLCVFVWDCSADLELDGLSV